MTVPRGRSLGLNAGSSEELLAAPGPRVPLSRPQAGLRSAAAPGCRAGSPGAGAASAGC